MSRWWFSLRWQLLGLVLLAVLPALGLLMLVGAERRRDAVDGAREFALKIARSSAESERRLVEDVELLLGTLAGIPAVHQFDREASTELFASILARNPIYTNIAAVRADGTIAASGRPIGGPVRVADREEIRGALELRRFTAGGYRLGRISGAHAIGFASPMLDRDGSVRGLVAASLDVDRLGRVSAHAPMPEGSVRFILDQQGTILFREPEAREWIGRRPNEALIDSMVAGGEGTVEGQGLDRVDRLYAFAPVPAGGEPWLVAGVGIPKDVVLAPARREFIRDAGAMILVVALALLAAWIGVETLVVRRARTLVRATQRVSSGDFGARVGETGGGELGELARAFDGMAGALEVRRAERDDVERAVRESEQRFRAVAQATNDAVWDLDLATGSVWWSEGVRSVLGYAPDEVPTAGSWWVEGIHPEDRERVVAGRKEAVEGGRQTWTDEYRFRRADRNWAYVFDRGVVIRGPGGAPMRMIGAMMDVTARRRAEEQMTTFARSLEQRVVERTRELAEANRELASEIRQRQQAEARIRGSQQELREFIDRMSALNAKVAPDGRLILVNRAGEAGAGLARDELLGTSFLDAPWWSFDPEVQARVREAFARALAGETVRWDERLSAQGREIVIDLGLAPVRDQEGQVEYVVVEGRDITEQKEAERAVQQRTAELEALNKELEAFSYTVSHDLKAPLRAIDGFSRILLEEHGGALAEEGAGHLRRIRDNAQQMAALIDDLLSFSRFSRQPLELRRVSPAPIVRQVLGELGEDGDRRLDIRIGELPPIEADPTLLKQVFVNLLSNALKYTRGRPVAVIEVGARAADGPNGESVYFVRDNGVGFDMRYADRLFGVFQRLHRPEEFEGTGVGLAIAQRIVFRHGGRIWAESEPGQGATFYFTLGARA